MSTMENDQEPWANSIQNKAPMHRTSKRLFVHIEIDLDELVDGTKEDLDHLADLMALDAMLG